MTVEQFETLVLSQQPATTPWKPVTDYSFEARTAIEGLHPKLIEQVFHPTRVLDYGCGFGHLIALLRLEGVDAHGYDPNLPSREQMQPAVRPNVTSELYLIPGAFDLVICREVLEHLTVRQIKQAVWRLCQFTTKFVYVTTRFAKDPKSLLDVDTSDDLDPTHISMCNKDFLRMLFVLEGFKRRKDLEERMDHMKKGRVLVYERAA